MSILYVLALIGMIRLSSRSNTLNDGLMPIQGTTDPERYYTDIGKSFVIDLPRLTSS